MRQKVVIYSKSWCPFCDRAKALLRRKGVAFDEVDVTGDRESERQMIERSGGRRTVPQIFVGDVHVGGFDDLAALDEAGRLDALLQAAGAGGEGENRMTNTSAKARASEGSDRVENVLILGSGPAGLTAAIYAARANLEPLVVEGVASGGQLMTTTDVENYPGFPEGIQGPEMMELFKKQAARFGTRFLLGDATEVDLERRPFRVTVEGRTVETRALIIATGASPKKLNVPGEQEYSGRGVSYCATCDGYFFREQPIVVVGGGDTAMEEAMFLARYGSSVTVVHRRDQLRASKILADRARANPKIQFAWNSVVEEVLGDDQKVTGVRIRNVKTGETRELPCGGFFVAIGHTPNTSIFQGKLPMDEQGYIRTEDCSTRTAVEGVFAAGDVRDHVYRQAVTAAGDGCKAAIDSERWLESQGH